MPYSIETQLDNQFTTMTTDWGIRQIIENNLKEWIKEMANKDKILQLSGLEQIN